MAYESSINKLFEMHLGAMARMYRDTQSTTSYTDMSFDERFAMLIDCEWDSRRENKRTRLLRQAGFSDPQANINDICYDSDRKLSKPQMLELSNGKWINEKRNVILTGASGCGKTWIANALGIAACNAFYSVRYIRLPEMLDELTLTKDTNWIKSKKRYEKCDLLILDDVLLEKISQEQARELLEIVEKRMRTGSFILCSQFPPSCWHARLGEGAIADAIIDRLVFNSYLIHIEGNESMRKRTSRFNQ